MIEDAPKTRPARDMTPVWEARRKAAARRRLDAALAVVTAAGGVVTFPETVDDPTR